MKALSLKCANCGAGLEISQEIDTFACSYCGVQQIVERSGGIVSLRRLEETLDAVKQGTNRAASELALTRLQTDLSAICAQRDKEMFALRTADERNKSIIGWSIIISEIAAIALFGWWSILVIVAGLFLAWRFNTPVSEKTKTVEANAEAKIAALKAQIARHQAIIDSYDFGSQGKK